MAYPSDSQYVPISITVSGVTQPVFDVVGDESPSSTDIVGNATFPAAFFAYDGANVYFRLRLNTDPRNNQLSGFRNFSWGVLIRTTSPPGFYDYMFNVNGLNSTLNIWQNTQQVFNSWNDPAEVLVVSQPISNFNFARVLPANSSFGGDPDFFLDWFLPATTFFNAIGINPTTQISTIFYSSANANNYNKDSLRTSEGFSFLASQSDPLSPDDVDVRARLAVSKTLTSGPNPVNLGQQATWTESVTVTNTGRSSATTVSLNDLIELNTISSLIVAATSQGSAVYNSSTRRVSWTIGNLAPGASASLTYSVTGIFNVTGARTLDSATVNGFDSFTGNALTSSTSNTINVTPVGNLFGRVIDNVTGLPIIGATITLSPGGLSTTSNSGGNYSFTSVAAGAYTVTVSATNYTTEIIGATITSGSATERNVSLTPVNGTVSGAVTSSGSPVSGVTINVINSVGVIVGTTTTTGAVGTNYSINVPPGNYTITATSPLYQFESRGITVQSNQNTTANFDLVAIVGSISGTITPSVPTRISIFTTEGIFVTSQENAVDTYSISGLAPGSYIVRAESAGYTTQQIGTVLTPTQLDSTVNFALVANSTTLSGQIRDGDTPGNPLIPGTVNVINNLGQNVATVTSNDGNYSVDGLGPGSYSVVFTSEGYASQTLGAIIADPPVPVILNTSLNKLAGSIVGTVNVPGATITLYQNGLPVGVTQSDGTGSYTFANLAPGNYTVVASAANFQAATSGAIVEAFITTTVNFQLESDPGFIFGVVSPDVNGAVITIRKDSATGPIVATTISGPIFDGMMTVDGYYRVDNLAPGNYVVSVNAVSFENAVSGTTVTANTGSEVNFTLQNQVSTISGQVRSPDGPIPGATIEVRLLDINGVVVANLVTDPNGNYLTPDLAFGTYTLVASAPNFQTNGATVVISDVTPITGIDIILQPFPGLIQGTIFNADFPTQGIQGATVQIVDQNGVLIQTLITDGQGRYLSTGLTPGGYTVIAFAEGFEQGLIGTTVFANTTSIANLTLENEPGSVSGTVRDNGTEIPNAIVQIFNSSGQFIATVVASELGAYSFGNLTPGSYTLTATAPGYATGLSGGIVVSNTNTVIDITLISDFGTLSGNVSTNDAPAGPIPNAIVIITDTNETVLGTAFTDANGNYSIGNLPVGNIIVTFTAPDFSTVSVGQVIAPSPVVTTLDVTLSRATGNLTGTVANSNNTSEFIENATVIVRSLATGTVVATLTTDQNGSYFVPGLSVGAYTVTAFAPNFSTEVIGATVVEGITTAANILLQPTTFTISGTVNATGPGILVSLYNADNVLLATTVGNSVDGSFQFTNIPDGIYFVSASAPGFDTNVVSVVVEGADRNITVPLSPTTATLTVTVLDSTTSDPIPGAEVVIKTSNNLILQSAVTGSDGTFTFSSLPVGSLIVTADAQNFGTDSKVVLTEPLPATNAVTLFLNPSPGNLQGFVTDIFTGLPIQGVAINLVDIAGAVVASAVSGQDGSYSFSGINPGTYTVVADALNYGPQTAGAIISPNDTLQLGFALFPNPGFISGIVQSGLMTIGGADIIIREGDPTGPIVWSGRTQISSDPGINGTFLTTGLNPGTYIVFVSADGFVSSQLGAIIVSDQTTNLVIDLSVVQYTISGTITDSGGVNGLPDTLVRIVDINGNIVGTTQTSGAFGQEGFYSISGISEGFYTVTAINVNFQPGARTVFVNADTTVDISLGNNPVSLSGVVFDSVTSIPLVGATVEIFNADTSLLIRRTLSTVNGQYLAEGLAPGNYRINTFYPNYEIGLNQLVLPALQNTILNIPLNSNPGSLSGTVTGPLNGANISIVITDTNLEVIRTISSPTGTPGVSEYQFNELPAGNYNLVVSADGFITEVIPIIILPGTATVQNVTLDPNPVSLTVNVQDGTPSPLENVAVTVYRLINGEFRFVVSGLTADDGSIVFNNLREGDQYLVIVQLEGYIAEQQDFTAVAPNNVLNFTLDENPSTIAGTLINRLDGSIINGATVILQGAIGPLADVTSNGQFYFSSLPEGEYTLTISAPGYQTRNINIIVPPNTMLQPVYTLFQNSPCTIPGEVEVSFTPVNENGNTVPLSSLVTLTLLENPEEESVDRYLVTVNGFVVLSYSSEEQTCSSGNIPLTQQTESYIVEAPEGTEVTLVLSQLDLLPTISCISVIEEGEEVFIPQQVLIEVLYTVTSTTTSLCTGPRPPRPKPVDPCKPCCEVICEKRVCEMSLYEYFRYKNMKRREKRGDVGGKSKDGCFHPPYPPPPPPPVPTVSRVIQEQTLLYTFNASDILFNCTDN